MCHDPDQRSTPTCPLWPTDSETTFVFGPALREKNSLNVEVALICRLYHELQWSKKNWAGQNPVVGVVRCRGSWHKHWILSDPLWAVLKEENLHKWPFLTWFRSSSPFRRSVSTWRKRPNTRWGLKPSWMTRAPKCQTSSNEQTTCLMKCGGRYAYYNSILVDRIGSVVYIDTPR